MSNIVDIVSTLKPNLKEINNLSKTLRVLSSMITPVVLIMASGSLILTTSNRLSQVMERTRALTDRVRDIATGADGKEHGQDEAASLFEQLQKASRRAKLLQKALVALYLTLSVFVATSIAIGIVDIINIRQTWIPFALGILGAALLFYASIVLIREAAVAVTAVDQEMNHSIQFFRKHFPELKRKQSSVWWRRPRN